MFSSGGTCSCVVCGAVPSDVCVVLSLAFGDDGALFLSPAKGESKCHQLATSDRDENTVQQKSLLMVLKECPSSPEEAPPRSSPSPARPLDRLSILSIRDVAQHLDVTVSPAQVRAAFLEHSVLRLMAVDFLFGQLLVGPLVTTCWRSAWLAVSYALDGRLPAHPHVVAAACVIGGAVATSGLAVAGRDVVAPLAGVGHGAGQGPGAGFRFRVVAAGFTLLVFVSYILLYKGWWDLCHLEAAGAGTDVTVLVLAFTGLVLLQAARNNIGFPLSMSVDTRDERYFEIRNFQWKKPTSTPLLLFSAQRVWSCALSAVIELLVISCWFGVWTLHDRVADAFRLDLVVRAAVSMVLGLSLALLAFVVQLPMLLLIWSVRSEEVRAAVLVLCNNILSAVALLSVVSKIKGVWCLLDIYLFPDHLAWSVVWSFLFSFSMLVALGCASTLHGGASADPRLGHGFLMPGFYATRIVLNQCFHKHTAAYIVDDACAEELQTPVTEVA